MPKPLAGETIYCGRHYVNHNMMKEEKGSGVLIAPALSRKDPDPLSRPNAAQLLKAGIEEGFIRVRRA